MRMHCSEFLRDVEQRLLEHVERARAATESLTDVGLNAKPATNPWSIAQIFAHMMLANGSYLPTMQAAISGNKPAKNPSPIQHSFFGRMLLKASGPQGNAPAPKSMRPKAGPFSRDVVEKWMVQTREIVELAKSAQGLDLCAIKVANPFFPIFKMNLADCFGILAEHTERHIGQIEGIAERTKAAVA